MSGNSKKRLFTAEKRRLKSNGPSNGASAHAVDDRIAFERHNEILDIINSLGKKLSGADNVSSSVVDDFKREVHESASLKVQLQDLSEAILETKKEIAVLGVSGHSDDHILAMTDQLDAVVGDTEKATDTILSACEIIDAQAERLRDHASDDEEAAWVDEVKDQVIKIFEACNFQDITGQRINKVVGTLKFIDERVAMMINILGGKDEFKELPLPEEVPMDDEKMLLNGPQLESAQKISQDEIDNLFD